MNAAHSLAAKQAGFDRNLFENETPKNRWVDVAYPEYVKQDSQRRPAQLTSATGLCSRTATATSVLDTSTTLMPPWRTTRTCTTRSRSGKSRTWRAIEECILSRWLLETCRQSTSNISFVRHHASAALGSWLNLAFLDRMCGSLASKQWGPWNSSQVHGPAEVSMPVPPSPASFYSSLGSDAY